MTNSILLASRDTYIALNSNRYWRYFIPSIVLALMFGLSSSAAAAIYSMLDEWKSGSEKGWMVDTAGDVSQIMWNITFEFFVLTLLSPLNAYLSEKIGEHFNHYPFRFSFKQYVRILLRSTTIAITAIAVQAVALLVFVLPFYFLGKPFFIVATVLTTSFFIGFAFFDYSLERNGQGFIKSWRWASRQAPLCFVVGFIFNVLCYVPLMLEHYFLYYTGIALLPPFITIFATMLYIHTMNSLKTEAVLTQ